MANHNVEHSRLVNEILVQLSKLKHVRVWKQTTGVFRDMHDDDRIIKVGTNGMADISGIITILGFGLRLEIEVKTGSGTQSMEQRAWEGMIKGRGGFYLVARSVEDAVNFCNTVVKNESY